MTVETEPETHISKLKRMLKTKGYPRLQVYYHPKQPKNPTEAPEIRENTE